MSYSTARDIRYVHAKDAIARKVDGEVFLIDNKRGRIHGLDPAASAIWAMLAEPTSVREIVDAISDVFPRRRRATISKAVRTTISKLLKLKMIVRRGGKARRVRSAGARA